MTLDTPVAKLFMVGPMYAKRLNKLNIKTIGDLLNHLPFRYLDYSLISPISRIQIGETVSLQGKITGFTSQYSKGGRQIQKAVIADNTGQIEAVWFNQAFLKNVIKPGAIISLAGKVSFFGPKKTLVSPDYEIIKPGQNSIHTGRLVPIYHETYGLSSKWLRSRIASLLKNVPVKDYLPAKILLQNSLTPLVWSLKQIHFPRTSQEAEKARERLAFDELLLLQMAGLQRKQAWQKKRLAPALRQKSQKLKIFIKSLPFKLTSAQNRAVKEILVDLGQKKPMNRLLQGDVGSGKTVVAAAAILTAWHNGWQSALMAPTEILAHQHFLTLSQILTPLGIKIELLTSSRRHKLADFDLLIGTHALIHKRAKFKKLGLVVIDEQHRFGVSQRARLISRKNKTPHILTMTATPIPRTVALICYGDLELSFLDEMPAGRQKIKTWLVPPVKRNAAYQWLKKEIQQNQTQAFVVCPFIEESNIETLQTVKAAVSEFKKLQKKVFPKLKLGLLHGRLKAKEKETVFKKFRERKIDILVATPVVEVGVDIENAAIMVIEAAERFGLAQLHQLRGRVGRGSQQSYCLLFTESHRQKTFQRLKFLQQAKSGRQLAEADLTIRGPGEVYGLKQHGFFQLQAASLTDWPLISQTKKAAENLISQLQLYPALQKKLKKYTIDPVNPN